MIRDLPHILGRIDCRPLLIHQPKLEALLIGLRAAMLQRGTASASPSDAAPAVETPSAERPRGYRIDRGVAILPIHGVLLRRAGQLNTAESTEFQSYERLGRTLRAARNDTRVHGVLLDVDSPGGEAGGIFELAGEVRRTTQHKPVWAIANDDALSAAYAIASAADKVWVTDTGAAGSIGVVALHLDQSKWDAEEGLAYSYIFRGDRKIDANPHEPLAVEARGAIQTEVDRLYNMLIDTVARHRGVEPGRLRNTEARIYYGGDAREAGLADRVGTLEQAHTALADQLSPTARRGVTRMEDTENVVNLDELREGAAKTATATALEIMAKCKLAKHPDLAAEFIAKGMSVDAVTGALFELMAREAEARQIVPVDTLDPPRAPNAGGEIRAANAERFRLYQTRIA